ncbi:DNA polymerase III subunit gamma/tau [Halarcobacter bivalviorum]|uniref:DNA polymerase III subunit gamma/tau n=1 Tax=Halarcobacter bivalviorum TaxID=663364 RepID=UPI00100BFE30|nr:DNA polymerase III subunit gamma/tau [Halarcobacter bivalviorum]RXK05668.1 DNA polymerase III subunit gamma/tau [Halarcobacter bivalviorum]
MSNEKQEKKVLALKYRPKRFEDLVGQTTISQTLSLALDSNRLSHAYLFSGLRGSGKTSTARIMAKALLCSNGPTSKPCEVCENCLSSNANRHLDVIEMDAASNRGIDDIKDLIEHTKYKPSSARFKVFIIDEVHMLTTQAFNALLKTLEEPPGFVKFILATTDPLKLPATILSRTQHFRFNKIANSDVMHHLSHILNEENIDFETPALDIVTRSGQGSLRDTLTLLDQAIIFSKGKITVSSVVDMLGLIEPELMDKLFEIILKKADITQLVKELENYEISQVCDEMTIYLRQKMLAKDAKFDLLLFDRFFRILSDAKHLLSLNSDGTFVLILTLSKMIEATNLKTIDDIINQVEEVEVKPVIKEAISVEKVVEHANNDLNHAYDDKPVQLNEQYHENMHKQNSISLDTLDAIPTVAPIESFEEKPKEVVSETTLNEPIQEVEEAKVEAEMQEDSFATPFDAFATPFDEEVIPVQEEQKVEESSFEQEVNISQAEESTPFDSVEVIPKSEEQSEVSSNVEEQKVEETVEQNLEEQKESFQEEVVSEVYDPNKDVYETLINKVYERDVELGELFERNFIYKSFENNKLQISSYAQGDERKFLLKHYGVIKIFIYDIFGQDTEIEFTKEDPSTRGA